MPVIRRRFPLILLGMLVILLAVASCAPAAAEARTVITPQEAQSRLQNDGHAVLLDVRTPQEWQNDGHAPGAILIPGTELAARLNELNRDDAIMVICRSGNRSQAAAALLRQSGFRNVVEVDGGMRRWAADGLPVE